MKRLFYLLFLLLPVSAQATETSLSMVGEPTNVTITATTLDGYYVAASSNSTTGFTLVRGSVDSTSHFKRFILSEPSNTYDLRFTYNPLTYTVTTDYGLISKSDLPLVRRLYLPTGLYVGLTFTTYYSGGAKVKVYFESEK